jgi:hypothetical protein
MLKATWEENKKHTPVVQMIMGALVLPVIGALCFLMGMCIMLVGLFRLPMWIISGGRKS